MLHRRVELKKRTNEPAYTEPQQDHQGALCLSEKDTVRGEINSYTGKKMFADQRSSTYPTARTTSSSSSSGARPRIFTPRTSSELGTFSGDETWRLSLTDEAQTCYNLILILRHDTQHLISLRNDNLVALEAISGLDEDAASSRKTLLACINESIVSTTRSISELGPFLERCRWPAATRPSSPTSQRRSGFAITLKPRRRRNKGFLDPVMTNYHDTTETRNGFPLSPEEIFAWTLALTAQHTAVLVATNRLGTFLESGYANVSEEETRRREGRQSWWEQGRGGFENVGLIQNLLARPKKALGVHGEESSEPAAVRAQALAAMRPENLTSIMECDDWRSETSFSEFLTPTLNGLTVRPRHQRMGSVQEEENFSVRRVFTGPMTASPTKVILYNDATISRRETFGSEQPVIPRSRFSSSKRRTRITTSPLPSAGPLQDIISLQAHNQAESTGIISTGNDHLSANRPGMQLLPPPFIPTESPEQTNVPQDDFNLQAANLQPLQQGLFPSSSPDVETPYTPYTPHTPVMLD